MANEITKNIENGEIIELLSKVGEIIKNNNTPFNVFEIINVCEKEVRMCMFFAELLNPLGSHNMNRCYFDLFFNTVLEGKFREFKNPIITKEEVSYDSYRRMDIIISDEESKQYVPIEVKIQFDTSNSSTI